MLINWSLTPKECMYTIYHLQKFILVDILCVIPNVLQFTYILRYFEGSTQTQTFELPRL